MSKKKKKEWWQTVFDKRYIKTYVDETTKDITDAQIRFLLRILPKRGALLDIACGYGRHAIPLAEKGFNVTGLDYSKYFIGLARKRAKERGVNVVFKRGDMRHISFKNRFNYVINMYTSFGYFSGEQENFAVLQKIAKALKRGGLFVFDFANSFRHFFDMMQRGKWQKTKKYFVKIDSKKQSNGLFLTTKHEFYPITMRWRMTEIWKERGRQKKYHVEVKMFLLPEIVHLLKDAGLTVKKVYGDYKLHSYNPVESPRMIVVARKK